MPCDNSLVLQIEFVSSNGTIGVARGFARQVPLGVAWGGTVVNHGFSYRYHYLTLGLLGIRPEIRAALPGTPLEPFDGNATSRQGWPSEANA